MNSISAGSTIIENIEQLREYLWVAMRIEHATIPPYLTTAYTAKPEANKPSVDILRAVAKEEMLHLLLAGNLLNAVGGKPDLLHADFVPSYPTYLPTGEKSFEVSIERFSLDAIETFLKIERPAPRPPAAGEVVKVSPDEPIQPNALQASGQENLSQDLLAENEPAHQLHGDVLMVPHNKLSAKRQQTAAKSLIPSIKVESAHGEVELHFWSIGEFYKAIELGFEKLSKSMSQEELFCGDPQRQIEPDSYYSGGGHAYKVTDLDSAKKALALISGQGEGYDRGVYDADHEIAHYYRFDQIRQERYYRVPDKHGNNGDEPGKPQGGKFPVDMDAVYPIKKDAKIADYHGNPELTEHALLFNSQYQEFLKLLNRGFNGEPELFDPNDPRKGGFADAMFQIGYAMRRLIHAPIPGTGENAAPTFEMNRCKRPSVN